MKCFVFSFFVVFSFLSIEAYSRPIDWNGVLLMDTTRINNYRMSKTNAGDTGSDANLVYGQEIPNGNGNEKNASFQSYILKLDPSIIINDSVSFKGSISTGYGNGGYLGDSPSRKKNDNADFANALYYHNFSNGGSNLNLTQFYTELFSDTATYVIGRQPVDWGMGAIFNKGRDHADRHVSIRDGVTAKLKLGNFMIAPHWAKINSANQLNSTTDVRDIGVALLYDNFERDIIFGVYYGKRKSASYVRASDQSSASNSGNALGGAEVKLIDIYLKKSFGKFEFQVEAPIMSGELGGVYNNDVTTKYKTSAILFESKYNFNDDWQVGLNLGTVPGDDGQQTQFKALYLNPNYQIANLMFRYNLYAISDSENDNVYDSYIVNTNYLKLYLNYRINAWKWNMAFIYAKAKEVAQTNKGSFNHQTNTFIETPKSTQKDDYGYEVDCGFNYAWNSNVDIRGTFGYHFVGDYYKYTNATDGSQRDITDSMLVSTSIILNY